MQLEPPPHDGINLWCLSSARKCQFMGMTPYEAESAILAFNGQTRRPLRQNEVRRAVERAYATVLPETTAHKPAKDKWEPMRTRKTNYRRTVTEREIWEASPWNIDHDLTQADVLRMLFPDPAGLVCVGKTAFEFYTARLAQFKNLQETQLIVPGYMTKKRGVTQDGKPSMHCLDNCGPRRFCVCDFDEPESGMHPTIIWHLRKLADLVMVVKSGGKSLHAWFSVAPDDEPDFWRAAIKCGADPALMRNRSSFVRMPMGTRNTGQRQGVLYFDPSKIKEFT